MAANLRERPEPSRARLRRPVAEQTLVADLREELAPAAEALALAQRRALRWVERGRRDPGDVTPVERAMESFPLDSAPGKALMSLAEALLRTPDPAAANELLAERLRNLRDFGGAGSSPVGGATGTRQVSSPRSSRIALSVLGGVGKLLRSPDPDAKWSISRLTSPLVAPIVRSTARGAIRRLSEGFIAGESIGAALERGARDPDLALCSFDMLGEGARTRADAQRYFEAYQEAIASLASQTAANLAERSSISVKLSALEPRYSELQRSNALRRLVPMVQTLAQAAARANIGLTIDAEEADRLDLSLDVIEAVAGDPATLAWHGLGLAVQAYNRHATDVIDWVIALARRLGRRMTVRIVKGAYWDAEIKRAQERGLETYPVFTAKFATDLNYLACVRRLFAAQDVIYPQIATHNAMTIAAALALAPPNATYEFQRLHGMGASLYALVRADVPELPAVRVYAPVGVYEDLLPYLVRRLLENGANSSFVHQFRDASVPAELVVKNPLAIVPSNKEPQPASTLSRIPEPAQLYAGDRANSEGVDWGNPDEIAALEQVARDSSHAWSGGPIVSGVPASMPGTPVLSPANRSDLIGHTRDATRDEIVAALNAAEAAQFAWDATPVATRAAALERAAELLEARRHDFVNLLVREAGKTLPDAIGEIREAADFCRYYAARALESFGAPTTLSGPTGERNLLSLHGRGVFLCISPWNFPLAIFTGQIVAALVAGNAVVAKPAPATTLVAYEMITLLHEAGIPTEVLHLTPSDGPPFSAVALPHRAVAGVAFTGSTATAVALNRGLANREGAIATLIAETGGVNAMIVDATALPEQVVDDLLASAFTSAGQRCSAARLVYIQEEIADRVIEMLIGAMQTLIIGDPADSDTDVGPLISPDAVARLRAHIDQMRREANILHACELPANLPEGNYFPPHLIELKALDQLRSEQFGPILHVVRYRRDQLPQVLAAIRNSGFGLTLGIQSRLESLPARVFRAAPVGNLYVNRNMIGATVGVQPFGGHGLSGTGPKAGGPHYLYRFASERTITVNTTAIGGNPELLTLAG